MSAQTSPPEKADQGKTPLVVGSAVRWSARLAGVLLLAVMIVLALGEGFPNPLRQPPSVQVELFALALALAGLVIGWWREAAGGGLILLGLAVFCAVELSVNQKFPRGLIPFFVVPGALFAASYVVNRPKVRQASARSAIKAVTK